MAAENGDFQASGWGLLPGSLPGERRGLGQRVQGTSTSTSWTMSPTSVPGSGDIEAGCQTQKIMVKVSKYIYL